MMSDQHSFRRFQDGLAARFGAGILDVRHELYFTARRGGRWQPKSLQAARAIGALALTIFHLMLRPGPRRIVGEVDGFLVASLPGANGWQTLQPLLAQAQSEGWAVAALWHPRLGYREPVLAVPVYWLPRPALADLAAAVLNALPYLRKHHPTVGGLAATATAVRGHLWRAAWRRLARDHPAALVLHNDFDLMGAAAVASGLPTMVLQHGTPTDEFFPCRAKVQAVWGETSAAVFAPELGPGQSLLMDGLGRLERAALRSTMAPDEIVLLSQTHTDIYGDDLKRQLLAWAAALEARALPFAVWLHPAEGPAPGPYRQAIAAPHSGLTKRGAAPKLVIGFSSTALLDAALAGHYVVGLAIDLPGSRSAQTVARPPLQIPNVDALTKLWLELQASSDARARVAAAGHAWIAASFAPTGAALAEWVKMAAQCSRS